MKLSRFFAYAGLAVIVAAGAIWYIMNDYYSRQASGQGLPANQVVMYKNANCQCCTRWAQHMEEAGFTVIQKKTDNMAEVKAKYGIPHNMESCHTALVNGYILEGHVPAKEVKKLLAEQPEATGLTVPGMPIGSPGMEMPGKRSDTYKVLLLGTDSVSTFAAY